nr:hypothetical protein Iba_chr13eCG12180 [Ipomoea batatas]
MHVQNTLNLLHSARPQLINSKPPTWDRGSFCSVEGFRLQCCCIVDVLCVGCIYLSSHLHVTYEQTTSASIQSNYGRGCGVW